MKIIRFLLVAIFSCTVVSMAERASAQGLIVSLPKQDGAWVRFEGTVKQTEFRPDAAQGDIQMEWIQHLTIKSVGSEKATFRGKEVPCRWIEIKQQTGKPSEAGVETGPVGERIYKVLVPEERVVGQTVDGEKVPFAFLDVVKGFRKIGNTEAKPIATSALQVFPLLAPVMHYDAVMKGNAPESVQLKTGAVNAIKFKGERKLESPSTRTINEAEIWQAAEPEAVPFGLVKWTVKTTLEKKDNSQPRTAFKAATQTVTEMSISEVGQGAKSDLVAK